MGDGDAGGTSMPGLPGDEHPSAALGGSPQHPSWLPQPGAAPAGFLPSPAVSEPAVTVYGKQMFYHLLIRLVCKSPEGSF